MEQRAISGNGWQQIAAESFIDYVSVASYITCRQSKFKALVSILSSQRRTTIGESRGRVAVVLLPFGGMSSQAMLTLLLKDIRPMIELFWSLIKQCQEQSKRRWVRKR